jgi:hypothetical protein
VEEDDDVHEIHIDEDDGDQESCTTYIPQDIIKQCEGKILQITAKTLPPSQEETEQIEYLNSVINAMNSINMI